METTIAFVLGVTCALGLTCLGYTFFMTLKINKKVKQIENVSEQASLEFGEVYRRIDEHITDVHKRIDEAFSHIDSRIDKTLNIISELEKTKLKD
jgi:hypothetical protein